MGILGKHYAHTLETNLALKFGIGLLISAVTARALGPSGRGEYNLVVLTITTFSTLVNFGVHASNTYFTAKRGIGLEKLFKSSIVLSLLASVASFLTLSVLHSTGWIRYLLPVDNLTPLMVGSLAILPVVFFNMFAQGIIVGENKIPLNNYISLASQGLLALSLTFLFVFGWLDVQLAVGLYALSFLMALGIILGHYSNSLRRLFRTVVSFAEYRKLMSMSLRIYLRNQLQYVNYRLPIYVVFYYFGTASVGIYMISVLLAETLWLVSTSMGSVLLPVMSAQHEQSKSLSMKAALGTFFLTITGSVVAAVVGPTLIVLLFGEAFTDAALPFLILLPGITIFSVTNVLETYIIGVGRPGLNSLISLVSVVFTIGSSLALIPVYGMVGAALTATGSYVISTILTVGVFMRLARVTLVDFWSTTLTLPADLKSARTRLTARLKELSL